MNRISAMKRIASILLLCCMLASMLPVTAYAAPTGRDGEVVKQGTLVASEDGMVTVQETIAHTSGNNFDVTMTVTTSDLVEIEPVRPAHIVLCIDRSNSMDGDRRTNTKAAVSQFVEGVLDEDGIAAGNQIAVVGFGTRYWTHSDLTSDVSQVESAITAATTAVSNVYDGGTNVQAGIYAAQQVLAKDSSTAQKVIVLFSDGMPTYSYRLTGTADWTGCSGSGRRHNWNQSRGTASNLSTRFDLNTIVGSGSDYEYNRDNHYASLTVSCEHGKSTTLTNKIYTNNGQPAIAQAQAAKDAGIEIYTVFLDGYAYNEQTSKKNAEDTMKGVATDEDHYMATQDMSELSDLFTSIGSSLVTPTDAGIVSAPMGSYIQLGDVSSLKSSGITKTATGLTWNVTAVTPTRDEATGVRRYTVTYPVSLQTDKPGFVESKPYAVNSSAVLTYFFGGVEKKVSFDIPTVRGYLPIVPYSISYYLQGNAASGDYANYILANTDTGLFGKLGSRVDFPAGYETKYADHVFVYSPSGTELALTSTSSNELCLYYDSTYVPPVEVNYSVRHEYYTNGELDSAVTVSQTAVGGSDVPASSLSKVPTYNGETYVYSSAIPAVLTATEGSTITLRYDRTVLPPPAPVSYTLRHEYYTNGVYDGGTAADLSNDSGYVVSEDTVCKILTYQDGEYTYTGSTPSMMTLTEGAANTMTLRYDRTVIIPPVEVGFTVRHEYFTNGYKDGENVVRSTGAEGTDLTASSVSQCNVYNGETYEFTSCTPESLTLTPGAENILVLRYDRTVVIPPAEVKYTVRHEYYTNNTLDGFVTAEQTDVESAVFTSDTLSKLPVYGEKTYTFTSCTPASLTLTVGEENTITLRYDRTEVYVPYTVAHVYYTNGEKDGEVPVQASALEDAEILGSAVEKKPVFSGEEYTFTGCTPESLTLTPGAENVLVLRYDRTVVIPPEEVNYTVVYEYYTNNSKDGTVSTLFTGLEASEITAENVSHCTAYNGETYTFTSCTPTSLTLTVGEENTITLRYDRTEVYIPYTVAHVYYTNGEKDGEVPVQASALEDAEILGSAVEKKPVFSGEEYTFTGCTPESLTLTPGAENVLVLRYDRTVVIPPEEVNYTVVYEYYTNNSKDGTVSTLFTGLEASEITAENVSHCTAYNGETYTFTSCTPTSLTLTVGEENTITLRYDRTEVYIPYTVTHVYYTNGEKDGEVPVQASALEDTEILGSAVEKRPVFSGEEYTFTGCTPERLTLTTGAENALVLRYDRTVVIPPAEVNYTVRHEYYTNDTLDGFVTTEQTNVEGTVFTSDTLSKLPVYGEKTYSFTSCVPASLTLTAGEENTITLRYDCTMDIPPVPVMARYTVIHQYYSGRKLDGQTQEFFEGDIGDIIAAAGVNKNPEFSDGIYKFTSANYEVIVLSENGENKIVLRYIREEAPAGPEPTGTPSTPMNPAPYNVLQRSPKTGDNSDTWLYIFAGAALALFLLFVVPIIPSRPEEGGRYRGSRRKK